MRALKALVDSFNPDEIRDDYDEKDFHMDEHSWAIFGKLAVVGAILFVAFEVAMRALT